MHIPLVEAFTGPSPSLLPSDNVHILVLLLGVTPPLSRIVNTVSLFTLTTLLLTETLLFVYISVPYVLCIMYGLSVILVMF